MPLDAAEHRALDPKLQQAHRQGRRAWAAHWREYRRLLARVAELERENEALRAALQPFLDAWASETATCMGGGTSTCQRSAILLDRAWVEAAVKALAPD